MQQLRCCSTLKLIYGALAAPLNSAPDQLVSYLQMKKAKNTHACMHTHPLSNWRHCRAPLTVYARCSPTPPCDSRRPALEQALLAAVPAARAALEELVSRSVFSDGGRRGDLRPLLGRFPPDCARACFQAVPQVCKNSWRSPVPASEDRV